MKIKHVIIFIKIHEHLTMVDLVSDSLYEAGEAQITIVVLALPPKDS